MLIKCFNVLQSIYFSLVCPEYELFAFVSHMGTSTMCGHYVAHIKKDQQ